MDSFIEFTLPEIALSFVGSIKCEIALNGQQFTRDENDKNTLIVVKAEEEEIEESTAAK